MQIQSFFRVIFIGAVLVFCSLSVHAHDQIPAAPQKHPIALVGGMVHTVGGPVIENGILLFDKGKIIDVGTDVKIPPDAQTIEITGKHVYPGLIAASSLLGLTEITVLRPNSDFQETGNINPNMRAEVAVNPDSERIPVTRANGIALAVTLPKGGLISGMAALIMLDGWTWEDMTFKAPLGMVVNWPRMRVTSAYGMHNSRDEQRIKKQLEALEKAFREARAYKAAREASGEKGVPFHKTDVRWEAMRSVLQGDLPVWVRANNLQEIESAVEWADREQVKMVLLGGCDAPLAADLLKRKNIPVIVTSVIRLPSRRHSNYDDPFTVPERLYKAGVTFCIAGENGGMGSSGGSGNERNLPYHAAMAAAYGLPRDEALKSITLYAAQILGVADRIGTLEKGKDATLIVTDGDPLEITTHVEKLYIQGRDVDLNNKQKMLYTKYLQKYRQTE